METVSTIAQAAAKAVWGENTTNGREPRSGAQGDTSKGEPFDKGNLEEPPTPDIQNNTTKNMALGTDAEFIKPTGTTTTGNLDSAKGTEFSKPIGTTTTGNLDSTRDTEFSKPIGTTTTGNLDSTRDTEFSKPVGTTNTGNLAKDTEFSKPQGATTTGNLAKDAEFSKPRGTAPIGETGPARDAEFAKSTGTAASGVPGSDGVNKTADPVTNESAALKAKATPADTTKGQNDVRAPEDPQTHPANEPTDVDDTGNGPNEAQKLDGPGPKPLEELARDNGGDAGKAASGTSLNGQTGEVNGHGAKQEEPTDPNDPHAKSTGEGTGEKYIKSSGLAADGGDFDATKAGAGAEADRLMEEKGMRATKGSDAKGNSDTSVNSGGSTEKKSLKDKIKDKLHRH